MSKADPKVPAQARRVECPGPSAQCLPSVLGCLLSGLEPAGECSLPACLPSAYALPLFLLCWSLFYLSPCVVLGVNMAVLIGALIGQTVTSLLSTTPLPFPSTCCSLLCFPGEPLRAMLMGPGTPSSSSAFLAHSCTLDVVY